MAKLNIEPNQLRALSHAYKQEADELRNRSYRLAAQTAPLLHDWVGSASSSFQTLTHNVDSRQRELISTLEKMAQILASAADAFDSEDQNISSAFDDGRG